MDTATLLIVAIGIGSMLFAGALARDWGRSQTRWVWIARTIQDQPACSALWSRRAILISRR